MSINSPVQPVVNSWYFLGRTAHEEERDAEQGGKGEHNYRETWDDLHGKPHFLHDDPTCQHAHSHGRQIHSTWGAPRALFSPKRQEKVTALSDWTPHSAKPTHEQAGVGNGSCVLPLQKLAEEGGQACDDGGEAALRQDQQQEKRVQQQVDKHPGKHWFNDRQTHIRGVGGKIQKRTK